MVLHGSCLLSSLSLILWILLTFFPLPPGRPRPESIAGMIILCLIFGARPFSHSGEIRRRTRLDLTLSTLDFAAEKSRGVPSKKRPASVPIWSMMLPLLPLVPGVIGGGVSAASSSRLKVTSIFIGKSKILSMSLQLLNELCFDELSSPE